MSRLHAIELHLLMLAGIAFLCVSGWQVWKVSNQITGTLGQLDSTRVKLNAELDEAHRLTLEAGLTAMEARKASTLELKYLPQWNAQIGQTMANANRTITAIQGTANATSQTLHRASLTLSTMNDSIAATKPLIEASTATVRDYGALAPYLKSTADNVQHMTFHFNAIAGDGQKIADKETTDFLKPTRWYMIPVKRLGEIWDVTAAVARHAP